MTNIKKEAKKIFAKGRKKRPRQSKKQFIKQVRVLAVIKRVFDQRTIKPESTISSWYDGWLEEEKRAKRKKLKLN